MLRQSLLLVFAFIVFSSNLLGQKKLKEKISADMCECLNNLNQTGKVGYPDLKNCLKEAMQNNTALVYEALKNEYGDSADYQKGVQYGERLARHIDTAMVYSCDAYFRIVDSLRFAFVNQYNKDSASKLLLTLKKGTSTLSSVFWLERGRLNFLTGRHQDALKDIEELEKDLQHKNTMLIIKGLCLDKIAKYHEAAAVFHQLAYLSNEHSYLVYAAIENRKSQVQKR